VASLLDAFLYNTQRAIQKKMTVGKFSWFFHFPLHQQ
jgi:hypothetical protein